MKNCFRQFPQALAQSGKRHKELKYPILLLLFLISVVCRGIDSVRTLAHPATRRRVMAVVISACMVVTILPLQAFAAKPTQNVGSLCEHHPVHRLECGYTEGMAGTPCTHDHTEDCYIEVTDCTHEHKLDCYNADAEIATNSETKEPVNCKHICDKDTGCITQELDCTHEHGKHDDTCGYTKETEGMPCTYICEICYPTENDAEIQPMEANALGVAVSSTDWELDDTGELTISNDAGMTDWVTNGLTNNKGTVITVTIANAVTDIPARAFMGCINLESVTADKATTINTSAFNGCKALTDASFPAAINIGDFAFENCAVLTSANLPAAINIGASAFKNCVALTSANFPMAKKIGNSAFFFCEKLDTLTLGATPPELLGKDVFASHPTDLKLNLVDANGAPLTGDELTNAQADYKAADDGDATDNLWYGWIISDTGWEINTDGSLTISTADGMTDWVKNGLEANKDKITTVTIDPSVTKIEDEAFKKCSILESVTAKGVTEIGTSAFYGCKALESIDFPKAETIGVYSFSYCTALASINFPVAKTISSSAFRNCTALKSTSLPAALTVNESSFSNCTALRSADFPKVTTIGTSAFYDCTALKSAIFPAAETISSSAFYGCNNLAALSLSATPPSVAAASTFSNCPPERVLNLVNADGIALTGEELTNAQADYKAVPGNDSNTTDNLWYGWTIADKGWKIDAGGNLTISSTAGMTDWVATGLKANKDKITTVTIDPSVTEIPENAFTKCENLESVTANGVKFIRMFAFQECSKLTSASFPLAEVINDLAFDNCKNLDTLTLDATPPPGSVGSMAFRDCSSGRKLNLVDENGDPLTETALTAAQTAYKKINDGNTKDNLWYGWIIADTGWQIDTDGNLTISTANGMTDWAENGLADNKTKVTTVIIDPSVTEIPKEAFAGCSKLATLTLGATPPNILSDNAFKDCSLDRKLNLVDTNGTPLTGDALTKAQAAYKDVDDGNTTDNLWYGWTIADKGWKIDAGGNLTISSTAGMTDWVNEGAETVDMDTLKTVTIDKAVTAIPEEAFVGYHSLESVTANGVTTIGNYAFYNCIMLSSASFPVATTIGEGAFDNCKGLTSVSFPAATIIGPSAFKTCKGLTSVNFPKATTIGRAAFVSCTALTSASFPAATTIGEYTFETCKKLAALSLPAVPPSVGVNAFLNGSPNRALKFVNSDGSILIGNALAVAQANYKKDVADGDTTDNLWYEWMIEDITVTSVEVTPNTANVQKGNTQHFTATVTGPNSPAQTVTWKVAGGAKAGTAISESGLLTVAADETATSLTVTATSTVDNTKSGTAAVITKDKPTTEPVTGVTLNKSAISLYSNTTPNTETLTATITPSTASNQGVLWSSGNTSVATVANGVVTAVGNGTTTITVTTADGGKTASCTVNVSTYRSTGSGGGGGGGSSSTTMPTRPSELVTSSSSITATVDKDGNVTTTVTDKNISDVVKAAKDAAAQTGVTVGDVTVVINVTAPADSTPNMVTVNLPKAVQEQIIGDKIGNVSIVIDKPDISIGMTLAAITEMNKQANMDIQLSATRTDTAKLSAEAKNAIGARPAFDLKATFANGNRNIINFGAGTVSVAIPYTLQNGEVAGGVYAVYVDDNGKVNYITNSSYDAEKRVLRFSTNHFSVYGISYKTPAGFADITDHWAKTDIEFVVNRGLISGTSSTTFAPNSEMTRGMLVTALGRLAGVDTNSYKTGRFTDVESDAYYAPYVNWAADMGIVKGTSDTTFAPAQAITRQEIAVIMSSYAKTMGYSIPKTRESITFADNSSIASWAEAAVKQMQMAGILSAKSNNTFDPAGTATRGEISAMLHRYVERVIDKSTSEGWTTNDSGCSMYYKNGKALVGAHTLDGIAHTFNGYGETTR